MSGSIKWMLYTDDNATPLAVKVDESNGEAAGFDDFIVGSPATKLPRGYTMRYANVIEPVSGARRRIFIGKNTDDLWTGAANTITLLLSNVSTGAASLIAFSVQSLVGSKYRDNPIPGDTGLTDGDVT